MGGQTLAFVFLCFCKRINIKGVRIHLIKSTNESFIDYYIYYRHAHLFSQKHKNAKTQRNGLARGFPSLVEEDQA